jgi:DNA repair exonuclease SbcCD nuclease subunit
MKIALICDTHFGVRGDRKVFLDHQEKFFKDVFYPELDKRGIKHIIDLGDTFDRRKQVNFITLARAREFFFEPLVQRGIEYHGLVGNHSAYFTNTNEINSLTLLLSDYDKYHIYVHDPEEIKLGGTTFLMVPWINRENQDKCLSAIASSTAHVLMGHLEINGFEMHRGSVCEHGMNQALFSDFEAVYSGHFHHPSRIGHIQYLGAQYEMTWADYGVDRGFHIFDTETRTLEFILNPYQLHHKLDYDDEDLTIEEVEEMDLSPLAGSFVKVVVQSRKNPYIFDRLITRIEQSGAEEVKVVEDKAVMETKSSEVIDEAKPTNELLTEYVDSVETTADKTRVARIMAELYAEALTIE